MRTLLAVLVAVAALGACSDPTTALQDEATCPGETCTDDTRARYDAIAALDRVTGVVRVSRSYGLDSGSAAGAQVDADVQDPAAAREVGEAVLGALADWPDQEFSVAEATVTADPAVDTDYVSRETEDLTNPYFEPCSPAECDEALASLEQRLRSEVEGLRDVTVEVRGQVLRITGSTDPDHYALAASGARRLVVDTALRLADRLEVQMTSRGPLTLTLRLQDGLVCEQPPGTTARCEDDNSEPFTNSAS